MIPYLVDNSKLSDELYSFIERTIKHFNEPWLIWGTDKHKGPQNLYYTENSHNIYKNVWKYEKHKYIEIFICLKGHCAMQIGNCIYNVKEGNICFIPSNEPHAEMIRNGQEYIGIWIAIHLGSIPVMN